ncbi:OmpP1/FadL family transporter [Thermodesulfobacteriota bacterium]
MIGIGISYAQAIQPIEIQSSMNPVGSGARAIGMGGAFIAVADDATAASWNPGGLTQLETPEVSIVGAYFHRNEDNTFGTNPEASGSQDVSKETINYLSAVYPFNLLNRNMVVSINYQHLYDFSRHWEFSLNRESETLQTYENIDYTLEGSLSALGVAYGIQIFPEFSFGLTLNFWEDGISPNKWKQATKQKGTGKQSGDTFDFDSTSKEKYEFSGFNINLGILWNVTSQFFFGAVFKSPFTADIDYSSSSSSEIQFSGFPSEYTSSSLDKNEKLDMPMSYGIGFSYRFSDKLTASADIYRTEWEDYVL